MHTIMITGSVKNTTTTKKNTTIHECEYAVFIWGCLKGNPIQFITELKFKTQIGYAALWQKAKEIVVDYFNDPQFQDGAYTQFRDHIIMIK